MYNIPKTSPGTATFDLANNTHPSTNILTFCLTFSPTVVEDRGRRGGFTPNFGTSWWIRYKQKA